MTTTSPASSADRVADGHQVAEITRRIGPGIKSICHSYGLTDGAPLVVQTVDGSKSLGAGWFIVTEPELAPTMPFAVAARIADLEATVARLRVDTINGCADALAEMYPDNANTNAFCAAIRSLASAPLPAKGEDAGRDAKLEPWRDELSQIIGHLGSAIVQSTASDDQIIMDHVKAAHEIAKIVRRKA